MIDVAVLVLVALRPWSRLLFGAFAGTVVFVMGWWFEFYSQAQIGRTAFFLTCFFLIFAFAPRLVRLKLKQSGAISEWDHLVIALMPIANAGLGFLAFYALFDSTTAEWAGAWLAVAFAAFYLLLARLPGGAALHESPAVLSSLHLSAAVVFLTIAIPLKAHGRWLTIGWLVEGAALLWASTRTGSKLLRVLALICLVLGLGAVLAVNPNASTVPFFNQRFGTHCVAIAVFVFVVLAGAARSAGREPIARDLVAGYRHGRIASRQLAHPSRHRLGDSQLLVVSKLERQHRAHARLPDVRAVHLLGILHGVRRRAAQRRFLAPLGLPPLAGAGTAGGGHRQGLPGRHQRTQPGLPHPQFSGPRRAPARGQLCVSARLAQSPFAGRPGAVNIIAALHPPGRRRISRDSLFPVRETHSEHAAASPADLSRGRSRTVRACRARACRSPPVPQWR